MNNETFDEYICIGLCCECTFLLREFKVCKTSYPFDWLATYTLKGIIKCISEDFKDFFDTTIEYNDFEKIEKCNQLSIKTYDIVIPHHNTETFKEQYKKKIKHWYETLNSDKHVLFVRKSHLDVIDSHDDVIELIDVIKRKYPNLYFKVMIINEYDVQNIQNNTYVCYDSIDKCITRNIVGYTLPIKILINCNYPGSNNKDKTLEVWRKCLYENNNLIKY